ncbi:MAG: YbbR-like domain-containing protein [Alphaproteobacteria bacterium]|nr:YbbR-like domain-containing protein [Alphaproteobacteria bacterium]
MTAARVRAWLRRFFLDNLVYKVLSLVLALSIWAWVQGEQVVEDSAWVRVDYALNSEMVLSQAPVSRVRLTVSGANAYVKELRRREPHLTVDLVEYPTGMHAIDFLDYEIEDLPPNVRVVGLVPPKLELELEPKVTRPVPLRSAQVGEPADGYRVKAISLLPDELEIEGPASEVDALADGLPTEGIVVTGLTQSVRREVEVPLRSRTIRRVDGDPVFAEIVIEPITDTRAFAEIPVIARSPRRWRPTVEAVEVTVRGPIRELEEMRDDQLTVMVVVPEETPARQITVGYDPAAAARFDVVGLGDNITVEQVRPARFTVEPVK